MVGLGIGLRHNYLLQVAGRTTGRVYSTPIDLLELKTGRFLVAAGGANVENLFEDGSLWGLLNVLEIPLRITDLVFLGHVDPTSLVGGAEGAGLGVILVYAAVVAGSVGYLVYRYRRVE